MVPDFTLDTRVADAKQDSCPRRTWERGGPAALCTPALCQGGRTELLRLTTLCVWGGGRLSLNIMHGHRPKCGHDKDGVTNRTCQVWPTAGTGHGDNSLESCWTVRQTYQDHGGTELTVRNADSPSRGRASRGWAFAKLAFGATCLPLQDSILEPP